jgi:GTP-binding protein
MTVAGPDEPRAARPVVAVVGRPNVGKSTLVNRILGRREAVVQDVPGVTRDRIAYDAQWSGREFTLVDTGGWELDAQGLQAKITAQAEYAVQTADLILFVVDARVGATEPDRAVIRTLRRSQTPVLLVATKVDDDRAESDVAELWSLGLGEPQAVSGLHGRTRPGRVSIRLAVRGGSLWSGVPTSASPASSTA